MLSCRHQHEEEYKKSYNYNLNGFQNLNFTHFKFHKIYFLYFELLQIREVSIDLIPTHKFANSVLLFHSLFKNTPIFMQ